MLPVSNELESLVTRLWNLPVPRTPSKADSPSLLSFNTALLQWIHRCQKILSFSDDPKNATADQLWRIFTTVTPKLAGGKSRRSHGPSLLVQFLEHGGVIEENKDKLCQLVAMVSQTDSLNPDDKLVWVAKRLKVIEPTKPGDMSLDEPVFQSLPGPKRLHERNRWLLRLLNHMLVDRPCGALQSSSTATSLETSSSREGLLQVSRMVLQVADTIRSQEVRFEVVQLVERVAHLSSPAISKYGKPFFKLFTQWAVDHALASTQRSDFVERVYGMLTAPYFPTPTKTLALRKTTNLLSNEATVSPQSEVILSEATLVSHIHGSSLLISAIFRSMDYSALQQPESRCYTFINHWMASLVVILRNSELPAVWQVGMEALHHLMTALFQTATGERLQSNCVDYLWVLLQYFHDILATTNQQESIGLPLAVWCRIGQWANGCVKIMELAPSPAIFIVRKILLERANTLNPLLNTFFTQNLADATFPTSVLRLLVHCVRFLVRQHRGTATGTTKCPWYDTNVNQCPCVTELAHALLTETTHFQRVLWRRSKEMTEKTGCGDVGTRKPGPVGLPNHFFLQNLEGPWAKICRDYPSLYLAYLCPGTSDLFHDTLYKISSSEHSDEANNMESITVAHYGGVTAPFASIAKFIQINWALLTQLISTLSADGSANDSTRDGGLFSPTSSKSLIDDVCAIWLAQSWTFSRMASDGLPCLSSLWPTWLHCLKEIPLEYRTLGPFSALFHYTLQAGPKPVPYVILMRLVDHMVTLWDKSAMQLSSPSYTSWKALVIPTLSASITPHLQLKVDRDQMMTLASLLGSMVHHFGAHYFDTTLLTAISRLMTHSDSEVRKAFGELWAKVPGIAQQTLIPLD
ncbi:hypothetical protein IWQ61_010207, partial [Dispira simplex]